MIELECIEIYPDLIYCCDTVILKFVKHVDCVTHPYVVLL